MPDETTSQDLSLKSGRTTRSLLVCALFAGIALLLYWPARSGGWTLDDAHNILHNQALRDFADSLHLFLRKRGVALFSFALNAEVTGLSPAPFRWVNVAIHTVNSLLVLLLLRQVTRVPWRWALLGGLIFLCHPVQTSAVSYIVQRMSLLSAGFALGAILLADRYLQCCASGGRRRAWSYLGFSFLCGVLSVLSKENTLLLPLFIPVLAWLRGEGQLSPGWRPALGLWLIFVLLAVTLVFASGLTFAQILTSGNSPLYKETGQVFYAALEPQEMVWLPLRYFLTQLDLFWVYLRLLFFPLFQAFDYCWPFAELMPTLVQASTLGLLGAISWLAWLRRHSQPLILAGIVWIAIFAAIESSFIPLDPIFEHRLYLPLVGVLMILYALLLPLLHRTAMVVAIALILCLALLSWQRNQFWGDPVRFWQECARQAPRSPRPLSHLARELFTQKRFEEAVTTIETMAAMYNLGDLQLGSALYFAGRKTEAMAAFRRAELRGDPGANGIELYRGHWALQEGRLVEAGEWIERAERKWRQDVPSLYMRGLLAEAIKDWSAAVSWYMQAIKVHEAADPLLYYNFNESYASWAAERISSLRQEQGLLISEP